VHVGGASLHPGKIDPLSGSEPLQGSHQRVQRMRQDVLELSRERARTGTMAGLADRPEREMAVGLQDLAEFGGATRELLKSRIPEELVSGAHEKLTARGELEKCAGVGAVQGERLLDIHVSAALERGARRGEMRRRRRADMNDIGARSRE
jgi:hypothetical protein